MAAPGNDAPTTPSIDDAITDNNLQPCFVLQKGSLRKSERNLSGAVKTRRKIDLSSASPKASEDVEDERKEENMKLRMEAFEIVWSKVESTIKDVLRDINTSVFSEIQTWVHESFNTIKSLGTPDFPEATQSFPIVRDANSKKLFTGLFFTKNMEFVDDLLTFEELGKHLKSQGCHVANLSSLDFTTKNGIGGCLRSLLRQFLMSTLDVTDMSILASWYGEQNYANPVVVVIDDIERCSGSVLSDFILMLSEWVVKIPVIFIMGVATTLDTMRKILTSNALQHLCPYEFTLGIPAERMDAIVKAVLLKPCSGFTIGHKVTVFMRNYFVSQDGTLTSFIRALKIACSLHFYMEPLSVILRECVLEEDNWELGIEKNGLSPELMLKYAFDLPSCQSDEMTEQTSESLAQAFSELKRLRNEWRAVVLCLHEAGKGEKVRLLDLYCEASDPESYNKRKAELDKDPDVPPSGPILIKGHAISEAIRLVRDLSTAQLGKLISIWESLTTGTEVYHRVFALKLLLKMEDGKSSKKDFTVTPK
ncbi:Origin recognition complex, subunit 3 [Corchorus capsularis]|uniref:Origin recognition complex, subunit 3 n=1 Tax=Corchorus capsularis TaxID=210143 RepID=A0A1R3JBV6_COCAP|nr:Origin recognition complex, subunit 3 [Corchorus capsularis]